MLQFACSPLSTTAAFFAYDCDCSLNAADPDDTALVVALTDAASDMLCILSGGRVFGRCTKTVRPVNHGNWCYPLPDSYVSGAYDEFGGLDVIPLRGPQTDIVEIRIDGAVLPTSAYRLVDDRYLLRVDGGAWPGVNSLALPFGSVGVWSIIYHFGYVPDKLASDAVNELVCELAKDSAGRKSNLPPGVRSLNIQGASASMEDAAEALRDGHENLPAVARFLGIWNPENLRATIGVWSPEMDRGWHLFEVEGPSGS